MKVDVQLLGTHPPLGASGSQAGPGYPRDPDLPPTLPSMEADDG